MMDEEKTTVIIAIPDTPEANVIRLGNVRATGNQ
jgi:hypothetical protein